jgi:hypothetical protein
VCDCRAHSSSNRIVHCGASNLIRFVFLIAASGHILFAAGEGRLLEKALGDFTFSCSLPDHVRRCLPNREAHASVPSDLDSGTVYVFNKLLPGGVSDMGFSELPERLRQAGCTVSSYPKGPKDLLFGTGGEPLFAIRCRCGGRTLQLRNRYNDLIDADVGLRQIWSTTPHGR